MFKLPKDGHVTPLVFGVFSSSARSMSKERLLAGVPKVFYNYVSTVNS